MEILAKYWSPIWGAASTLALLVLALMQKTYAKRDDYNALAKQVELMKSRMDELPTRAELHRLELKMSELHGEIKVIQPDVRGIRHLADLLLQNELKDNKP